MKSAHVSLNHLAEIPAVLANLTARQNTALKICVDYMRDNDQLPCHEALAEQMGLRSTNAARHHFQELCKAGLLERNRAGKFRFTRIKGQSIYEILKNENFQFSQLRLHDLHVWNKNGKL